MSKHTEVRELLWRLIRDNVPAACFEATVIEVDEQERTCSLAPANGDPQLFSARLVSIVDELDSYCYIVPAIGSTVLALVLNNDPIDVFIVSASSISAIIYKIGERTFRADGQAHVFDGGQLGGLPVIGSLVERLNRLEDRMLSHQHLSASPGQPTTNDPITNPGWQNTTVADIENDKVQQ